MKKDLLSTKAIELLYKATMLYKNDLLLFIAYQSTRQNASQIIRRLINSNIIACQKVKGVEACYLTKKGKQGIIIDKPLSKDFHTTDEEVLSRKLQENTIKVLFAICGIPAFYDEKIPLGEIRATMLGLNNRSTLRYEQASNFLNKGAYYTKKEWADFVSLVSLGKSDTFVGSRFKGVYISDNNCYFVYMPERGDNKILRINYEKEAYLKASAEVLKSFTNIFRDIPELYTYKQSKNDPTKLIPASKVKNEAYALVISDGNAQTYSMVTGNPRGLIKNIDFSSLVNKRKRAAEIRAEEESERQIQELFGAARIKAKVKYGQVFLDAYNDIYNHLFVVSRNFSGIRSLDYLCTNTLETWKEESLDLFKTNPKYFIKTNNPIFPYVEHVGERKIPAIYLPVYDVKILRTLSEKDYSSTVATYEDMIETIAHSTRKQHRFYDADFYLEDKKIVARLFDKDATYIYDYSGYIKGELMIRDYLEEQGLEVVDKYIYSKLPTLCGHEQSTVFYNKIARGELDIESIVSKIETKEIDNTKHRNIKKSICIHVSNDFYERIKKAAKYDNMSIQQSIVQMIREPVNQKCKTFNDNLQKKKREWAQE